MASLSQVTSARARQSNTTATHPTRSFSGTFPTQVTEGDLLKEYGLFDMEDGDRADHLLHYLALERNRNIRTTKMLNQKTAELAELRKKVVEVKSVAWDNGFDTGQDEVQNEIVYPLEQDLDNVKEELRKTTEELERLKANEADGQANKPITVSYDEGNKRYYAFWLPDEDTFHGIAGGKPHSRQIDERGETISGRVPEFRGKGTRKMSSNITGYEEHKMRKALSEYLSSNPVYGK